MLRLTYAFLLILLLLACKGDQVKTQEEATGDFAKSQILELSKEKDHKVVFFSQTGDKIGPYAAALFNQLAKKRNINLVAVSRSLAPPDVVDPQLIFQLDAEKMPLVEKNPKALSDFDILYAKKIIALNVMPEKYKGAGHVDDWLDVKPILNGSEIDYDEMRNALTPKINALFAIHEN